MIMENDATLAEAVRNHIMLTLASCCGNRTHAARILDISLRCLRDKLRGYANAGIRVIPAQQPRLENGRAVRCRPKRKKAALLIAQNGRVSSVNGARTAA